MSKRRIPFNEADLAYIRFDSTLVLSYLDKSKKNLLRLSETAESLSLQDASELECIIPTQNIQNSVVELKMYIDLADMILQHISSDIDTIFKARKIYEDVGVRQLVLEQNRERQKRHRERAKKSALEQK